MDFSSAITNWKAIDPSRAQQLAEARLRMHWAVQPLAAFGRQLVPPSPDDSHTSLDWDGTHQFLSQASTTGHRAAFDTDTFTLALLDEAGRVIADMSMAGGTLADALTWLGREARLAVVGDANLEVPDYDIPDHGIGSGADVMLPDAEDIVQLSKWYSNAASLFHEVRRVETRASEVRTWPHHFDIATLIALDDPGAGESSRSVGVGLSPGDGSYAEPYLYVSPWPYPDAVTGLSLAGGGEWHTEGFTAAVLPASRLDVGAQAVQAAEFLTSAIAQSLAALS